MKKESEIIGKIIEVARKLERTQIAKDDYLQRPTSGTEQALKERQEKIQQYDIDICSLGEKLNTFIWLFKEKE